MSDKVNLREGPRTREIRKKISDSNPNKKWVKTPYGTFKSIGEACRELKEFSRMIHYYCEKGKLQRELGLGKITSTQDYREWEMQENDHKLQRHVETPLGVFLTVAAAARTHNVTSAAICHRIKKESPGFRYITEEEYFNRVEK